MKKKDCSVIIDEAFEEVCKKFNLKFENEDFKTLAKVFICIDLLKKAFQFYDKNLTDFNYFEPISWSYSDVFKGKF